MPDPTKHKKPEKSVENTPKGVRRVSARPMWVGGATASSVRMNGGAK